MKYTFFFLLFSITTVICQPNWELARNRNGVVVYTKNYKDKGLKQLKAETTVTGISLHSFLAVFKDLDKTNQWTSNLHYSKCLKIMSPTEQVNYFIVNIPWPLKKREGIFHVYVTQDPHDFTVIIESNAYPDFIAETDTAVRLRDAKAIWRFTPIGNNQIKIQSIIYADPRGLPPFLVNLFVTDTPLETMINLKEFVKHEKYKNAKFDFIREQSR